VFGVIGHFLRFGPKETHPIVEAKRP
jgi:hypothetical protein